MSVVLSGFDVMAAVVIDMMEDADGARIGSDFFEGVMDTVSAFGSLRFNLELDLSDAFEFDLEGGGFESSFFPRPFEAAEPSRDEI